MVKIEMSKLNLYSIFHGNLNYSSIPRESYHDIIDLCYWPILNAIKEPIAPPATKNKNT